MLNISVHFVRFKPHCPSICGLLHKMSHVAWSVCVYVCLGTRISPAKTAELIDMRMGGGYLRGPERTLLYEVDVAPWERAMFVGLSGLLKSIGSLPCGVCSKRDITQSSMTA